jgi:hypothetical protein
MKDNGKMESSMDQVFGEDRRETPILGSGKREKLRAMVCILGPMETDTKANSKIV